MTDADKVQEVLKPPLSAEEADIIWYAPAGGLSTSLLLVLFMDLAIVVALVSNGMILLGVALLATLGLLVGFSLLNAAHLLGPGGITIQRPFGTESRRWDLFSGWRVDGSDLRLEYAQPHEGRHLVLHTRDNTDEVIEGVDKYLPRLPEAAAPEQAPSGDERADG